MESLVWKEYKAILAKNTFKSHSLWIKQEVWLRNRKVCSTCRARKIVPRKPILKYTKKFEGQQIRTDGQVGMMGAIGTAATSAIDAATGIPSIGAD